MKLSFHNLGKRYRQDVWGVKGISLEIAPGIVGLLGPNGAGKSTLMKMAATITQPTTGRILWKGRDLAKEPNHLRQVLGYLPQDFGIYPHLNAGEFLEYMAAMKRLNPGEAKDQINSLLDLVNLGDARFRPLGGYSGGMKQRVGIAQALLNDPELLIVDEPTAGLDPRERVRFRNLLSDLAGERIIILSTHIVPDVEAVATDIVLIQEGKLVRHARPEELLEDVEGKVWEAVVPSAEMMGFRAEHLVGNAVHRSDGVHARVIADDRPPGGKGPLPAVLEDAYLFHVQKGAAD